MKENISDSTELSFHAPFVQKKKRFQDNYSLSQTLKADFANQINYILFSVQKLNMHHKMLYFQPRYRVYVFPLK